LTKAAAQCSIAWEIDAPRRLVTTKPPDFQFSIYNFMPRIQLLSALAAAAMLCGCDKQVQVNTQKIDAVTQKMFAVQQAQSKQLADLQAQLAVLASRMDKTAADYYVQSQDKALFYHTNTLYFLLTIDKKIQSELQLAEAARASDSSRAFFYHTNTLDTIYFCTSQIADALTAQEKRLQDSVKTETAQWGKTLGDELASRKKVAAEDHDEMMKQLAALQTKLAQIQSDLNQLKAQIGGANRPASQP
jgi:hypothetical protein